MKFKTDENLPVEVTARLRSEGHDAMSVLEQGLGGESDRRLVEICRTEQRAMITLDTDFADIRAYPPSQGAGYVVFRLQRQDKESVLAILERLLPMFEQEPLNQRLWIVDEQKVRIRE